MPNKHWGCLIWWKQRKATKHFTDFSPGPLQATAVHYTVLVILQYRYPPAEFSHTNSFAVSGGGVHAFCMTRCTEAACKYSCAEGISWHSRFFSWWPLQLVATDAESKTASLLDTSQSVMVKCFMFEAVHALKGNNKHVFLQTITSKSTSRSQQLVAAVTRLNYCLCWTTGTPRGRHSLCYR